MADSRIDELRRRLERDPASRLFAQLAPGPVTPELRELTARTISRVRGSDEAREGFAAFLGKRPADWIPR